MEDDELVNLLVDKMSVVELREWMRNQNISRSRGEPKKVSAQKCVKEEPEAVKELLGFGGWKYHVGCICGFEEKPDDRTEALKLAKEHSIKTEKCGAQVWARNGEMLYGKRGLDPMRQN